MFRRLSPIILAFAWLIFAGGNARAQAPSSQPDLGETRRGGSGLASDMIRINTSNPPGNEMAVAKYISGILQKEGIPNEVVEITPGRGVAIGRLQAGPLPDPANALLLVAHQDTVGVDPTRWSVDPFGAVIREGYLYGRGSIDDKAMLAANLATVVALKRAGARLGRDVIFLASADEEQGGSASIKVVIEKYWDKIACAYALNEGGRVDAKRRQGAIRRDPGERKSLLQRHRYCYGTLGARFDAAPGQCGGAPGRGYRETRDLPGAGRPQYDYAALLRTARKDRGGRYRQMDARTRTARASGPGGEASLRTESHVELDAARFDHADDHQRRIPEQRDSLGGHGQLECANAPRTFHRRTDRAIRQDRQRPSDQVQARPRSRAKTRRLPTSPARCTRPSNASLRRIFPGPSLFLFFPPGRPIPPASAFTRFRPMAWIPSLSPRAMMRECTGTMNAFRSRAFAKVSRSCIMWSRTSPPRSRLKKPHTPSR